jgi:phospholipid/cholesterol/gamma-HCH transport system permease protein
VTPRLIATAVVLPLLTIIADFMGLIGGYIIATTLLSITGSQFWTSAWQILEFNDLVQGLLKPFAFAIIISLVGCLYGMRTTGGTQGVGRATTKAVVSASVWIFFTTFMITRTFVHV